MPSCAIWYVFGTHPSLEDSDWMLRVPKHPKHPKQPKHLAPSCRWKPWAVKSGAIHTQHGDHFSVRKESRNGIPLAHWPISWWFDCDWRYWSHQASWSCEGLMSHDPSLRAALRRPCLHPCDPRTHAMAPWCLQKHNVTISIYQHSLQRLHRLYAFDGHRYPSQVN